MDFWNSTTVILKSAAEEYQFFTFQKKLTDQPTRVTSRSNTILDSVLTTFDKNNIKCRSYGQSFYDHEALLVEKLSTLVNLHKQSMFQKELIYSQANIDGSVYLLSQVDWDFFDGSLGVNKNFEIFFIFEHFAHIVFKVFSS